MGLRHSAQRPFRPPATRRGPFHHGRAVNRFEPNRRAGWALALLLFALGCRSATPPPAEVGRIADNYAVRDLGPGRCLAISDEGLIAGFVEPAIDAGQPTVDGGSHTGAFLFTPDGQRSFTQSFLGKRAPGDAFSVVTRIRGAHLVGFTQGPASPQCSAIS